MAIETVLCCYIADEEMFPPELRFAENELKHAISHSSNAAIEKGGFTKVKVRTLLFFFMIAFLWLITTYIPYIGATRAEGLGTTQ